MNLRHIEIIHAIVQYGSISSAARALHVSQPNVTRVLAHAEQQLGFALFERSAQGLVPRPETLRLIPEIEQLMQQRGAIDTLVAHLKRGESCHLRLGAAQTLGQTILPQLLLKAHQQMPEVAVELTTGHWETLCDALLRQRLDVALVFGQHTQPGIQREVIATCPLMALLPPGTPPRSTIRLDELGHSPVLMQPQDPLGTLLHSALEHHAIELHSPWLIQSYTVIAEMVALGAGIGVVDAFTARRYPQLHSVPLTPALTGEISLITLARQQLSLPAETLCQLLRHHL
ncbi:LysR family transcriptional regulator [Carnimonas nigrificans]|uniref:LysR family transcriptional regulator n=1 Tax=Carnimonas nigrificans TaxID=64323 RepID=UPI0004AC7ADF|nr:LysR family transcriptional regulator [Carnimonas nigrificans]